MVVSLGSFLGLRLFELLDVSGRVNLSIEPHENGERSNQSKSVVLVDPMVLEMVSVREQSNFGGQGVRVFHLTSTHSDCSVEIG